VGLALNGWVRADPTLIGVAVALLAAAALGYLGHRAWHARRPRAAPPKGRR
jgi:hypothetical protein